MATSILLYSTETSKTYLISDVPTPVTIDTDGVQFLTGSNVESSLYQSAEIIALATSRRVGAIIDNLTVDLAALISAAGASSFNGRGGDVLPTSGDYTAAQITYSDAALPHLGTSDVQGALDALKAVGAASTVTGPLSSTDNAIARFNGTTGNTIQNSLVIISDTGTVTLPANQEIDVAGHGGGSLNIMTADHSGGAGGSLTLATGAGSAAGAGGDIVIETGGGGLSGGNIFITATDADGSGVGNASGITIETANGIGTNKNGGDLSVILGNKTGSGRIGRIIVQPNNDVFTSSLDFRLIAGSNKILTVPNSTGTLALTGDVTVNELEIQYARALIAGPHMQVNLRGLDLLTPFSGSENQTQADTRAEALRTAMIAHMAGVGTSSVNGEHLAADSVQSGILSGIPPATNLGTCIALINGLHAADIAHGGSSGVHFHEDFTEETDTITVNPPVTLGNCLTDLNDLLTDFLAHFGRGPDDIPVAPQFTSATPNTLALRGNSSECSFGDTTVANLHMTSTVIDSVGALNITPAGDLVIGPGINGYSTTLESSNNGTFNVPGGALTIKTPSSLYGTGSISITTEDALVDGSGGDINITAGNAAGLLHNGGSVNVVYGVRDTSGVNGSFTLRRSDALSAALDVSSIAGISKTFSFPNASGTLEIVKATQQVSKTVTAATLTSIVGTMSSSLTLPANFWSVGRQIRLKMNGFESAITSATQRWQVKLGTTVIGDTGVSTVAAALTNSFFELDFVITCKAVGGVGVGFLYAQGDVRYSNAGTVQTMPMVNTAAVGYDTTAATQLLDVLLTYGATNASNTATSANFSVEILN